jgi:cytochrome P450
MSTLLTSGGPFPNISQLPTFLLITASTATATALFLTYETLLRPRKNSTVPGPKAWPFVGHIPLLSSYINDRREHELSDYMNEHYGTLTRIELGAGDNHLFVSDATLAHTIFSDIKNFGKDQQAQVLSQGIVRYALFFMPTDEAWKRHRKFMQPGFGPSHLRATVDASNAVMDALCEIWDRKHQKLELEVSVTSAKNSFNTDLFHVASSFTIDVIGLVAFSYHYNSIQNHEFPESQKQLQSYQKALDMVTKRIPFPGWVWGMLGIGVKDAEVETHILKKTIMETIEAKRAAKKVEMMSDAGNVNEEEGGEEGSGRMHPKTLKAMTHLDVLDRLLEVEGWTDEEIVDEVIALFLAGGETSANTIVFCCKLIDAHPHVRAKLLEELDSVFGKPTPNSQPEPILYDDLSKLHYTECIIKESLRLHPVVILAAPRLVKNPAGVQLNSHHIAPGTNVHIDIRGIHRNASYWSEPLEFKPERWENGFVPTPGTYMPFGEGPHKCLGFKMAMLEIKVVLARLWSRYNLSVVKEQEARLVSSITHGFKDGILFDVEPRKV